MSSRKKGEPCVRGVRMLCKYCNQKRACPDSEYIGVTDEMIDRHKKLCRITSDGFYDTFKEFHKLYVPHWSLGEVFELFLCHICQVNNVTDLADVDFFHATNNEMFAYLESFIDKIKGTTNT